MEREAKSKEKYYFPAHVRSTKKKKTQNKYITKLMQILFCINSLHSWEICIWASINYSKNP